MAQSGARLKVVVHCILAMISWNCFSSPQIAAQSKPTLPPTVVGKYVGPGSCSAAACHGGVSDSKGTRAMQTEYSTWIVRDWHAKAYHSLENQVSLRMGKILGLNTPPASSSKCLVCHTLATAPSQRERDFDIREGVSCESCHGPASGWLESHIRKDAKTEDSVKAGMYNISNMALRSEKCLTCHLGTEGKEVDHAMIAAGHPDLIFQLDLYSAKQPPHWRLPDDLQDPIVRKDPSYGVRLWAVGQAVQLREALNRLERRAQKSWPEFSELDCFSCHHSLTKPESSWRQERDCSLANRASGNNQEHGCSFMKAGSSWPQMAEYHNQIEKDRTAGSPPWNSAHYSIFLIMAKEIDPDTTQLAAELETELQNVYRATGKLSNPGKDVAESAHRASAKAAALVGRINDARFSKQRAAHLLQKISAQGGSISYQDTRSAEQAWMALDSLLRCYEKQNGIKTTSQKEKPQSAYPAVHAALDKLYHEFDNPSAYNAPRFAAEMREFNTALREGGIATPTSR